MSRSNFKQEWVSFMGAVFSPSVIFSLVVTIALFVGAYNAPDPWSTILYVVTTAVSGFVATQFNKRFKFGMTKEEVLLEDTILADTLEMSPPGMNKQHKALVKYIVKRLRR